MAVDLLVFIDISKCNSHRLLLSSNYYLLAYLLVPLQSLHVANKQKKTQKLLLNLLAMMPLQTLMLLPLKQTLLLMKLKLLLKTLVLKLPKALTLLVQLRQTL